MTQRASRLQPLFQNYGASSTGRAIGNVAHWVGCSFIATKTATIDRVALNVTAISSPAGTLEAAIVNIDSAGLPLGSDISKSSDQGSTLASGSMAANTSYELTVSASVTKGSGYGIIIRPTTWTSGTVSIGQTATPYFVDNSTYPMSWPYPSYNIGTETKSSGISPLGVRYGATDGYLPTPGLGAAASKTISPASAVTGNCAGNLFTTDRVVTLAGYLVLGEFDNESTVAIFAGTDNTEMSGTSATILPALRSQASTSSHMLLLATPKVLPVGTYRVALKNSSAVASSLDYFRYSVQARNKQIFGMEIQRTDYASGAWTETSGGAWSVWPLIEATPDDAPMPFHLLGI